MSHDYHIPKQLSPSNNMKRRRKVADIVLWLIFVQDNDCSSSNTIAELLAYYY